MPLPRTRQRWRHSAVDCWRNRNTRQRRRQRYVFARRATKATLASITESLDRGLTQALGLLNLWLGVIPDGVEVLLNKDFFGEQMSADEAVKLMQIAQQGYMSVDNLMFLYDRGELLRPGVEPQEERELIELQQSIQSVMQAEG